MSELKTSEEWYKDYAWVILDPDGWDRSNYEHSWKEELISLEEFNTRASHSTQLCKKVEFNKEG